MLDIFKRLPRIPRRLAREIDLHTRLTALRLVNQFGRYSVTADGGPVVSLTSYGKRINQVYLAIESIGWGQVLPSRVILWLDDIKAVNDPPKTLRRLQARGLEIKRCKNLGPHKKYYPYLESLEEIADPLVTADDDVLYPRYWLKKLVEAFQQFPDVVHCPRARLVGFRQESIARYDDWEFVDPTNPSFRHFAIGVGGVLYPPSLQQELKRGGTEFENCCPKADDIWLHAQTIRSGFKVRQIGRKVLRLVCIPGTQSNALHLDNLEGGQNDRQIQTTYRPADVSRLRES